MIMRMRPRKPQGLILWQGKSQLTGKRVVLIVTGIKRPSRNQKTGDMLQTWILVEGSSPVAAINSGQDRDT